MMRRNATALIGMAVIVLPVALAGCITQPSRPTDCDRAAVTRSVALIGDRLEPENIDVCRDQQVSIQIDVQRDGVLHLHGYDDQGAAIEVRDGEPATLTFVAVRTGQFVLELHPTDSPDGVGAGILTVHEP